MDLVISDFVRSDHVASTSDAQVERINWNEWIALDWAGTEPTRDSRFVSAGQDSTLPRPSSGSCFIKQDATIRNPDCVGQSESPTASELRVSPSEQSTELFPSKEKVPSRPLAEDFSRTSRRSNLSLKCEHPGCSYDGTFRRHYELERHIRVRHDNKAQFQCPVMGCFKGSRRTTFFRADKLTSHLRHIHGQEILYNCVEPGCDLKNLEGDLMFVHLQGHLQSPPSQVGKQTRAVLNALSPAIRECPVWDCRAKVSLQGLSSHLLRHEQSKITVLCEELIIMNYLCTRSGCSHEHASLSGQACLCPVTAVLVVCPLCRLQCLDHQGFYMHMMEVHMLRTAQHFHTWTAHVLQMLVVSGYELQSSSLEQDPACVWKAWRFTLLSLDTVNLNLRCPACDIVEVVEDGRPVMHHLSMLANHKTLSHHRRQILALFPDFGSHPVFEDIFPCRVQHVQVFRVKKFTPITKGRTVLDSVRDDIANAALLRQNSTQQDDMLPVLADTFSSQDQTLLSTQYQATHIDPLVLLGIGGQFHDVSTGGGRSEELDASVTHCLFEINEPSLFADGESLISWDDISTLQQTSNNADVWPHKISSTVAPTVESSASRGKPHLCNHPDCNYAFERQSDLRLHQRSHVSNDERPHSCSRCSQRFLYPKDLQRHLKTHYQPDRFCTIDGCDKAFRRQDHLLRHIETVHGQDSRF